tara:strand:+ start:161 stop:385 length:225 start_codon:yes stop_codon:yes gene_type:complete
MAYKSLTYRLENYSFINLKVMECIDNFSNLNEFKEWVFKLQNTNYWFTAPNKKISNYVINQIIMNEWERKSEEV